MEQMRRTILLALFTMFLFLLNVTHSAASPSFDCDRARGTQIVKAWNTGTGDYFFRPDRKAMCKMNIATVAKGVCGEDPRAQ